MAIIAGVLSTGPNFVFAYTQDPIVSRVIIIKAASEISVRIAGSGQNARRLAGDYSVGANGAIVLPEPVGSVTVVGSDAAQATAEITSRLKTSHLFIAPQVKLVAGGSGTVAAGQRVKIRVVESASPQFCRVDQNGNITLDQIGVMNVAGKSVLEVREMIAAKVRAMKLLTTPSVSVDTGNLLAPFPVWAVGMMAGALVNFLFPLYLMRRNHSGHLLLTSWRELPFPLLGGMQFFAAILLLGIGSLQLGALGASVGWGLFQAMQVLGGQAVGFLSGEWRGVNGKPRTQMYLAIAIIVVAACVMAFGNTRPKI
jgi:protein involved in polysaccharide export with SLBB domain